MVYLGYLIMAAFGIHYFFTGYRYYRYEQMLRGGGDELSQLMGLALRASPINPRAATALGLAISIGINVLLGYACGVPLQGALIAVGVGVIFGLLIYLVVIRPMRNAAKRTFGEVSSLFGEGLKAARQKQSGDHTTITDVTGVISSGNCDALDPTRRGCCDEKKDDGAKKDEAPKTETPPAPTAAENATEAPVAPPVICKPSDDTNRPSAG